jgi:hypothetical protein
MPENPPLYDSDSGKSNAMSSAAKPAINDNELVRLLYSKLNAALYPFVIEVIDAYDYNGSPIYSEDGIDRETLAQLVTRVLDLAADYMDEVSEIRLEATSPNIPVGWDRQLMLNSIVQSLILNNIFMYRRPRRNAILKSYSFKDGQYNGLTAS